MRLKPIISLLFSFYVLSALAQSKQTLQLKDFLLEDVNGKPYNLNALKGKIVYVDCWYPACSPCRGEMPWEAFLIRRTKNLGIDTGIIFVTICFKQTRKEWLDALNKIPVPGNIHLYAENQKYLKELVIDESYPTYRIFNKQGELDKTESPSPSEMMKIDFILFAQTKNMNVKTAKKVLVPDMDFTKIHNLVFKDFMKIFTPYMNAFFSEATKLSSAK